MNVITQRRWFFIALPALSFCWWPAGSLAQSQTSLQERFATEAPKAWSEAKQLNQNVEFEISSISQNWTEDGIKWTSREQTIVKARGNMFLDQITTQPAEGSDLSAPLKRLTEPQSRVNAVNDTDAFTLNREGASAWVLSYVTPVNDSRAVASIGKHARQLVQYPWCFADQYLSDLHSSAGFHVDRIDSAQDGDEALVKVSFTYTPQANDDKSVLRSGWVLLRPNERWSIRRGEANLVYRKGDRAKLTMSIDYRPHEDVVPVKAVLSLVFVNKSRGYNKSAEFLKFERHQIPVSEFTMAAYGINMSVVPQTNQLPWILLNIGVVLLIIGIILYRRFRSSARPTS